MGFILMILKKIFISVFTFAFVMLFVSKTFANENNDSEKTVTERSHDLNPNDYPIIDIYAEIGLNQLTSEIIYFQFDASGAGSDDWKFSSIVVDFYVSREYKVNNYINNMGIVESLYV